jgi:hypothetical protein
MLAKQGGKAHEPYAVQLSRKMSPSVSYLLGQMGRQV